MRKLLFVVISLIAVLIVGSIAAYSYMTSDNQKDKKVWEQLRIQLTEDNIREISIHKSEKVLLETKEFTKVLSLIRESDFNRSNRIGHGPTPEATVIIVLADGTTVHVGYWGTTFEFSPEHIDVESQFIVTNDTLGNWIQNLSEVQTHIVEAEMMTVTKGQLMNVTPDMTYEEVIRILGRGKDLGSGLYVFLYEYIDGQQFTLNFAGWNGTITEEHYNKIREIISYSQADNITELRERKEAIHGFQSWYFIRPIAVRHLHHINI